MSREEGDCCTDGERSNTEMDETKEGKAAKKPQLSK